MGSDGESPTSAPPLASVTVMLSWQLLLSDTGVTFTAVTNWYSGFDGFPAFVATIPMMKIITAIRIKAILFGPRFSVGSISIILH